MVGGVEFITKIFLYYLHERAWLQIPYRIFEKKESGIQSPQ